MCPVCHQRPAEVGVLCEECRDELSSPIKIMPEQIQLHGARPTMAALIDIWGRPHRLDREPWLAIRAASQRARRAAGGALGGETFTTRSVHHGSHALVHAP